jgi:hypothetical protein
MMQRKRGNKPRKRAGGRKPPRGIIPHPPMIGSYAVIHGTRLRFVTNAAVAQTITYQNLLDLILVGQTALLANDLFHSVKIRRIQAWATPVLGTSTTIEIQMSGSTAGSVGSYKLVTDTSQGIEPAYVSATPVRMTLASMYQQSSAATAFSIIGPSGMVVDLDLSFKNDPGLSVAAQNATVGATIGAVAYRGMDGLAAAATKFVPAVLPSI